MSLSAAVQAPVERGLYFDEFTVGQSWVTPARTITDHGPGVFAVATGLESRLGVKEGTAIAFLGMNWNLKGAVRIGDTIHVEQQVAELRPSKSKPDRGIVTFDVQVKNQRDEVCQDGQWFVMFQRRL